MFGISPAFGARRNRPMINNTTSQSLRQMIDLDLKLLGNFIGFLEYIKVIFEQKGFVASGLKASVVVAKKPVTFLAPPKPQG